MTFSRERVVLFSPRMLRSKSSGEKDGKKHPAVGGGEVCQTKPSSGNCSLLSLLRDSELSVTKGFGACCGNWSAHWAVSAPF